MIKNNNHSSSFRDPSGYIFVEEGVVKRTILPVYFKQYNALNSSGFFSKLFKNNLLIPHTELLNSDSKIIIQPEQIPFITYPYEWSFNQYKEAALLTLKLQKYSLENGFSLKDASAFNVTFHNGRAVFIDTLSFDFYKENSPWRAYKQFITHFLGPLVLAKYHGANSLKLLSNYIDGIPIKMLASMLPFKTKLNPFLYTNIHLLAKFDDKHNKDYSGEVKVAKLTKKEQFKIIDSLYTYIKNLTLNESTEWGDYYSKTNYSDQSLIAKTEIINVYVNQIKPKRLIDVGGNTGVFVRSLNAEFEQALICDIDNNAIDENYKTLKENNETSIIPFVLDVLNPTAAIGFNNKERFSFLNRIQKFTPNLTLALAVIHHMSVSGNVPFDMSANFFASFSTNLIIEFPKREDSWVQRLLNNKADFREYFDFYTIQNFEAAYLQYFDLVSKNKIENTNRVMYLFKAKNVR